MSDCCTSNTGFPSASSMAQMATNNVVTWGEIGMIQQAILAAASQCQVGGAQMCTTVGGNTPMTFITGINTVNVTNPGAGYYADSPSLVFVPPNNSSASGATGILTTNGGNITSVTVTNGGTGYQPVHSALGLSTLTGTGAILQPLVNANGQIISVNIANNGVGYTISDSIIATRAIMPDPAYIDAAIRISAVSTNGEILSVIITNPGTGYQDSVTTINIVSTLSPATVYPWGTGFQSTVQTNSAGVITGVSVSSSGWGYSTVNPYLTITDPGTGAITQVNLTGNTVGSISVLTAGSNYTQSATGTVFNPSTAPLPNPPTTPATVEINVNNNTYGTNPMLYWQTWAGTTTNKQITTQLNTVLSYFKQLGYTITIQSNPATGNTIQWKICW